MACSVNISNTKLINLSAVIESCYGVQEDDTAAVVKLDLPGKGQNQFQSLTSAIFSKFLNSTRTGSAHMQAGISLRTFLSSMLVSAVYFLLQVVLFTILRNKFKCIYQTRTMNKSQRLFSASEKPKGSLKQWFSWIPTVIFSSTEKYQDRAGLDAYFFLRFLKTQSLFFLTLSMLNMPILLPIHYHSSMTNLSSDPSPWLDRMNISSLVAQNSNKLVFHMILGIFVVIWFHAFLIRELKFVHEVSLAVQQEASSILLIERIPECMVGDAQKVTSSIGILFPERILDVRFLPKTFGKLRKLHKRMLRAEEDVEELTMKILLNRFFLNACEENNEEYRGLAYTQKFALQLNKLLFYLKTPERIIESTEMQKSGSAWLSGHAFKFNSSSYRAKLYLSLDIATKRFEKASAEWMQGCAQLQKQGSSRYDLGNRALISQIYLNKVFVKFSSMNDARAAVGLLRNGSDDKWKRVHLISDLSDIVWSNVRASNPTLIRLRLASANLLSVLIIVGYIIPVAFVGLISQIPYLASLTAFYSESEADRGSELVREMMAGLVPVITLIFLTECVPFIFCWLSYLRCKKTSAEMQSDVQNWFFAFLFVHVFLVVTISSSLSIVLEKIVNNPVSIPTMLANDLPKSSNFFCSFILVRGLAYSGGNLLQIKELFFEFYYRLTIYTPHRRMKRMESIPNIQWCSVYPIFSVLGCISIVYSVISPLILPLSCISFSLVMFSFKYLYEYQYNRDGFSRIEGRLYPSSLMQMYAGIYCMEFCMIGLFALGNCFKLCMCMILSLGFTIVAHVQVYRQCLSKLYAFNFKQYCEKNPNIGSFSGLSSRCIDFPFANGEYRSQILIPKDTEGSTANERDHLAREFHLEFKSSNFNLNRTGDIVYQL
ncbi:hypothetical protein HG536_0E04280 [Torulaspora globosa]|uniref:CSC1/OSCA1-like 7TM region domain-containing protein n=1 Tax=Torulaspora globosa TaxID=48254 RepID=A0A7G3ZJ31_9SACH|nr:uncharacterized protein HG536_0E04280 [Torulaspora globosa]QLL33517.1 hypothetical protein HG536_0E04280 [Torulaspora globosa]